MLCLYLNVLLLTPDLRQVRTLSLHKLLTLYVGIEKLVPVLVDNNTKTYVVRNAE